MPKGFTYTATSPNGEVVTRYSVRHLHPCFTHAVIPEHNAGSPSFCGSYALAQNEVRARQRNNSHRERAGLPLRVFHICPVTAVAGRIAKAKP